VKIFVAVSANSNTIWTTLAWSKILTKLYQIFQKKIIILM